MQTLHYWKTKPVYDKWLLIECPVLDDAEISKPFWIRKRVVQEMLAIEKMIKQSSVFVGWIGHTKVKHSNVILMYAKRGGKPFKINIKEKTIWFNKVI